MMFRSSKKTDCLARERNFEYFIKSEIHDLIIKKTERVQNVCATEEHAAGAGRRHSEIIRTPH